MNDVAIETCHLSKTFDRSVQAVANLDLKIPRGVVYGLIGRNGAGKTTLIRLLMGLLRPTGGAASVLGTSMWKATCAQRQRVAYVSQSQQSDAWMTVGELCHYVGSLYQRWDMPYAQRLANRFGLPWDKPVGILSGGQQRKAAVLLAFASRAEVLLLDEPAAGLDPIARRELITEMVDIIAEGNGTTILLSTHIISDLERIAEYVGVMDQGRMSLSEASLSDLQARTRRVQVVFEGSPPRGFAIPGAIRSKTEGPVITAVVNVATEGQLDGIRGLPGVRVNEFPMGLEDIFIELFGPASDKEPTEQPR